MPDRVYKFAEFLYRQRYGLRESDPLPPVDSFEWSAFMQQARDIIFFTDQQDIQLVTKDQLRDQNDELKGMINAALEMAHVGQFDGAHHKTWVIDQMVRILTGDSYDDWVRDYCAGEDGPDTYGWDEGVAP